MDPNNGYLGPNRRQVEGLGTHTQHVNKCAPILPTQGLIDVRLLSGCGGGHCKGCMGLTWGPQRPHNRERQQGSSIFFARNSSSIIIRGSAAAKRPSDRPE